MDHVVGHIWHLPPTQVASGKSRFMLRFLPKNAIILVVRSCFHCFFSSHRHFFSTLRSDLWLLDRGSRDEEAGSLSRSGDARCPGRCPDGRMVWSKRFWFIPRHPNTKEGFWTPKTYPKTHQTSGGIWISRVMFNLSFNGTLVVWGLLVWIPKGVLYERNAYTIRGSPVESLNTNQPKSPSFHYSH